jgi:hypothetical protein
LSRVLRSFVFLAVLGVGGLLLLIAAQRFDRPELIGPGLLLFALGTMAAGANIMVRRYSGEVLRTTATRTFVGPAAVLTGLAVVILGLGFAVAGAAFTFRVEDRLAAYLLERPGAALIAAGAACASGGLARLLGAREWGGSTRHLLAHFPERLGGMFLVLLGLALSGVGIFEVVQPETFDAWIAPLAAPFRGVGS